MTSLAKQLKSLAVQRVDPNLGSDNKRISLLFDPKDAANLDVETVFALGCNGLEELEELDSSFGFYRDTLFNEANLKYERMMQSKDGNDNLNKIINKFLIHVSPFFLVRPAHKALEWLIYRYRIHIFNVNSFLACILPFHDTVAFVKAIRTLHLEDGNRWAWLQVNKDSGTPLNRHVMVQRCKTDLAFFKFMCSLTKKFYKVHGNSDSQMRVACGVVALTLVGCLQQRDEISEEIISEVVNWAIKSLKSKCIQLKSAGYLVLTQLLSEVRIQPEVLQIILKALSKNICEPVYSCGIKCLAIACYKNNIKELPTRCQQNLAGIVHPAMDILNAVLNPRQEEQTEEPMIIEESEPTDLSEEESAVEEEDPAVKHRQMLKEEEEREEAAVTFLRGLAKHDQVPTEEDVMKALLMDRSLRKIVKLQKKLMNVLPLAYQRKVISKMLDKVLCSGPEQLVAQQALTKMKIKGTWALHELQAEGVQLDSVRNYKASANRQSTLNLKRLTVVLELLSGQSKLKQSKELTSELFDLLDKLQNEQALSAVYCMELILLTLYNLCSTWSSDTPENQEMCKVEVLVHCIRSDSLQLQQQALLLMAKLAAIFPDYTLHNAMSLFTLMGDCILQRDDSYTFQTVQKVLDTLVPVLLENPPSSVPSGCEVRHHILEIFVAARHHVPRHRVEALYKHLLELLGSSECGWVLVVQVVQSMVCTERTDEDLEKSFETDFELVSLIVDQLSTEHQLATVHNLLSFMSSLTPVNANAKGTKRLKPLQPLHIKSLSAASLRQIQLFLTRMVAALLTRDAFIRKVVATLLTVQASILDTFEHTVKESLSYFIHVTKAQAQAGAHPLARFWKAVLVKTYIILAKINYLLPNHIFLRIVQPLLEHELVGARKKALEIFADKLQHIDPIKLQLEEENQLLHLLQSLMKLVLDKKPLQCSSQDEITLKQMALFCVKQMTKVIGAKHPQEFQTVLRNLVDLLTVYSSEMGTSTSCDALLGTCILCIGELCMCLKALALESFPTFMPHMVNYLGHSRSGPLNDVLVSCELTAVQKVVTCLRNFVSPYLADIVLNMCQLSNRLIKEAEKKQALSKIKVLRHHLATDLEARVLVPVFLETAQKLLNSTHKEGLFCLLLLIQEHISAIPNDQLHTHLPTIEKVYYVLLGVRCSVTDVDPSVILNLEDLAIKTLVGFVTKLSENTFRPFYYRLFEWACLEEETALKPRCISFFKLSERLAIHLKSLFNLFVDNVLNKAIDLLNINSNGQDSEVDFFGEGDTAVSLSCELLEYIMGMLYQCLLHDGSSIVTQEIFDGLLEAVVNQSENFLGGTEVYQKRLIQHVLPCLTQLASCCAEETWMKSLNYQVCLKTRHSSAQVRFASVKILEGLVDKLTDSYIPFLPETMPFLAELMEDESEEVEHEVQSFVTKLEGLVSEPLKNFF